jgi:ABC-type transporter Mla MlaB component
MAETGGRFWKYTTILGDEYGSVSIDPEGLQLRSRDALDGHMPVETARSLAVAILDRWPLDVSERAERDRRVEELEGEITRQRLGSALLGMESESWYLALQMLVARLLLDHLPVATVRRVLAEITSDVATDFTSRISHSALRHLDSLARVLLADVRDVVRERGSRVEP